MPKPTNEQFANMVKSAMVNVDKGLTDFEWAALEALVRAYGAKYIAELAMDMGFNQEDDDDVAD